MRILGIDLGTTNSAVAVLNAHGVAEMIANREGEYTTPSVVCFDGETPVVGSSARHSAVLEPLNVVQFVKRHIGNAAWTFVTEDGTSYGAEDISAMILRRLKEDAEAACGETFSHAVITVPAYFSDAQRRATKDAGRIAGLEVPRIINEPTAAALAYGLEAGGSSKVLVYDLGGGTFDVTILDVTPSALTVLATGGDRNLGGFEWDNRLMSWINDQFQAAGGASLLDDPRATQDLRERCEMAKRTLSQMSTAKVVVSGGGLNRTVPITLEQFEDLTRDLLERTEVVMDGVLEDASLTWSSISKVLLVGGSTRMRAVPTLIERVTGIKPSRELHPDEVVALGAALQAGKLAIELGMSDPATGDSELARINLVEIEIADVTAHSMGILALDLQTNLEQNHVLLTRNTRVPCSASKHFATVVEDQTHLLARVTQGEGGDPQYVTIIGEATLALPFTRPKGTPFWVEVSYDLDGLMQATFTDPTTGLPFGKVDVDRKENLTSKAIDQKRERLGGMAIG
jgi:molecular chaperone DnaK